MLQLFTDTGRRVATLTNCKNIKIVINLSDGDKQLSFSVSTANEYGSDIKNEYYIKTKTDEFVIKDVTEGEKDQISVVATLNLEGLEGKMFSSFKTTEKTISECLSVALAGTGWSVGTCEISKKRTIKKDAPCNALDIIKQCVSTYACEVQYNTIAKTVNIFERIGTDRGAYFIESLNLRKCKIRRTSYTFYTRLIPIGKDGVGINIDGKNYVEDHTYSQKIKTYIWKDERYTIPSSLAEDAAIKLAEMAKPYNVYTADIIDLARSSEMYSNILDYDIGDIVTLISKKTRTKEKMRIAKITIYPFSPEKNSCELSNSKKSFADIQAEQFQQIVEEAVATSDSNTDEAVADTEIIITEEAALLIQGVETEVLQKVSESYATKSEATDKAAAALTAAQGYTDKQLESYKTSAQTDTAIANAIQGVVNDFASKAEATNKASAALAAAEAYTDDKLRAYQTAAEIAGIYTTKSEATDKAAAALAAAEEYADEKTTYTDAATNKQYKVGVAGGLIYLEEI